MTTPEPALTVKDLHILYRPEKIPAVRGVSFEIYDGETFAIVGESGSGKTSIAMSILGFVKPESGGIMFKGTDVWSLKGGALREIRRRIQPVFQDAHGSLNPRMTVAKAVGDGLRYKNIKEVLKLLRAVDLGEEHLDRYPHQLSGGQKQRVCLARALAPAPDILILDEPLSAQDISIQAHLLNLLANLKKQKGLTYVLISHDLRVVRSFAQRVAVMKQGILVEESDIQTILNKPQHPHTEQLLRSSGF